MTDFTTLDTFLDPSPGVVLHLDYNLDLNHDLDLDVDLDLDLDPPPGVVLHWHLPFRRPSSRALGLLPS